MKFLCLCYGDEKVWNALSKLQQDILLSQDTVLRERGDLTAPLGTPTTLRVPDGRSITTPGPFATSNLPLAGFSLIEAASLEEVIELVKDTPCAQAGGAVEIWPVKE